MKVAIHGAAGRMGQRLIAIGAADPDVELVAALEDPGHPRFGECAGALAGVTGLELPFSTQLPAAADVVIDFSVPSAALALIEQAAAQGVPLIVATTGFDADAERRLQRAAEAIPVVWAPSMSTAVNLVMKLTQIAAETLRDHSGGVDVEIVERHHRFKEDAPSGTALRFGQIVADGMGQTAHTHGREGRPGVRPRDEIGYHALRTGDNPGEHTIVFGLMGETIELRVAATNRDCYAHGAYAAARYLMGKPAGLYSMQDVLGI